ncbi:MAG: alpha/beta hydrolase [Spirochaetales bacterium]|nr:alpha/beta hydrolase [Spirochaetales bacterium]
MQRKRQSIASVVLGMVLGMALVGVLGFAVWTRAARYEAFPEASVLARQASVSRGWLVFQPPKNEGQEPDTGLIFYPGGLVDPAAYAPLMRRLADAGLLVVMVPMPLDLAIFGVDSASKVIPTYPEIRHWLIGGHSLGGAMAAEFVKRHPDLVRGESTPLLSVKENAAESGRLEGLVLLASYPARSTDLSALPLHVVSIYGSEDGVTSAEFEHSLRRLPSDTRLMRLEGANHAQFGNYGPQKGDGTATIERAQQQSLTVEAVRELVTRIHQHQPD